jgi:hypothetical protein
MTENIIIYFHRNPTPEDSQFDTWNSVSTSTSVDYAQIRNDGIEIVQDLMKDRTEFWANLPLKARIPNSVKDEL